jgi:DNA-directed RNA polymerases I, II, and III subunit RPABC2
MDTIIDEELDVIDVFDENEDSCDGEYDIDDVYETIQTTENITHFMENYKEYKKSYTTSNYLTKYEKTRVLSERTQQIESGCIPLIPNVERFTTAYQIAVEEFNTKRIPYIIRRPLPDSSGHEYWKLSDMIF